MQGGSHVICLSRRWSRWNRRFFYVPYVWLDFKYNCEVIILMISHMEWRIDKWHITMASYVRHGVSTHWQLYCLLNGSFRQTLKKTSRLCTAELLWIKSSGDGIVAHWTTKAPPQWPLATGIHWLAVVLLHPMWRESTGDQWFHSTQGQ